MTGFAPLGADALGSDAADAVGSTIGSIPLGQGPIGSSAIGGVVVTPTSLTLSAESGSVVLTGQDSTYQYIVDTIARGGTYTLAGQPAQFVARTLFAGPGAFTLAGQNADQNWVRTLDPFRSSVSFLHHCDNLTESVYNATIYNVGGAAVSTAVSKFGAGSFETSATKYFYTPGNGVTAFQFSTNPFTIDLWVRFKSAQTRGVFFSQDAAFWFFIWDGGIFFRAGPYGADQSVSGTFATPTPGQWYYLSVDRDASNVLRVYVDGVMVSKTTGFTSVMSSTASVNMGRWQNDSSIYLDGYLDDIRVTKGVARYGSDAGFTVPTEPSSIGILRPSVGAFTATGFGSTYSKTGPYLFARTGQFHLGGQKARLNGADAGAYTLTGQDADLRQYIPTRMSAGVGSFTVSPGTATLDRRKAILGTPASVSLIGRAARFLYNQYLPVTGTAYALTGRDARLGFTRKVFASSGAFTSFGPATALLRNRRLVASGGSVALSGSAAFSVTARRVFADRGVFTFTGASSGYLQNQRLRCGAADFRALTRPARLLRAARLAANWAQFAVTGLDARLFRGHVLSTSAGSFGWDGVSAKRSMVRVGSPGRFRVTAQAVELWAGWGGDAVGYVSSPVATAQVAAQGAAQGNVIAPIAQATWSDR